MIPVHYIVTILVLAGCQLKKQEGCKPEKLETENVYHFCVKNDLMEYQMHSR